MSNRNHFSATKGFTLIEASLGLGAAAVLGLAALGLYRSSDASAKVRLEQAHISALAQAIESSLGIVGSFASVSVERVVEDQLVPATLLKGTLLRNAWGGSVEVAPYAFSQPNDSFAVVYGSVPAKACSDLGSALGNQVSDLKVNGQSTLLDGGVDPALLAARCKDGATLLFVFHSGLASGTAVAATPVTIPPPVVAPPSAPPSPPGPSVAPPVISPVVVTPPVIVAPPVATSPPASPGYAPTPGAPPPPLFVSLPAGPPATPPGNAPACIVLLAALPDVVSTRTTTPCASGRYGVVGEQRTQDWFCPDFFGNPSTIVPLTYEPWAKPKFVMTPWTQVSTTCALCPAPQTESVTQWVGASALCPSGQVGSINWEKAQSHTRSNTVQCGTPTPAGPTAGMSVSPWSAWSAWTDTGATRNLVNSCAPAPCTGASTDTRLDPRTGGCPAGQTGGTSWNAEQTTSRVCNSGTWGSWAAWTDTGNTSGFVSTCTPTAAPCALPSPSTETEPRWTPTSTLCPSGQTGTHTWEFAESRSRTATCPAPTGSYTWGGWTAWAATGATRNLVNTCAPTAPPPPPCGSWTLVNTTTSPNWASLMGEFISVNNGVTTCSAGWGWGLGVGTPAIQADRNAFAACEATRGAKPIGPNAHYEFTEYSDWGGVATNSEEYVGPATCSPPPPTMCVTRTDIQYSTVNGGDGFHELAYTLGAGGNTAYCTERDPVPQCTDILVETQLGMTFAQWSSACQVGDTWYKRSSETGHTTTEWVQEVAETFTCNVCP